MPQFDSTFFSSQIFWLFICLIIIFWTLKTQLLPKINKLLEERKERTEKFQSQLDSIAQQLKEIQWENEQQVQIAYTNAKIQVSEASRKLKKEVQDAIEQFDKQHSAEYIKLQKKLELNLKEMDLDSLAKDLTTKIVNKLLDINIAPKDKSKK